MRIVRYRHRDRTGYGVLHHDRVAPIVGDPFQPRRPTGEGLPLDKVRLLAPVQPANVIGIGRNAGDDVPEVPVAFRKPATGVVGPGEAIAPGSTASCGRRRASPSWPGPGRDPGVPGPTRPPPRP